jgi:hypothetical protein
VKSLTTPQFWILFKALPTKVQQLAKKNYGLWRDNPAHPSIQFKRFGMGLWSARVGTHYRAIGRFTEDDVFVWLWIGSHESYNKIR